MGGSQVAARRRPTDLPQAARPHLDTPALAQVLIFSVGFCWPAACGQCGSGMRPRDSSYRPPVELGERQRQAPHAEFSPR